MVEERVAIEIYGKSYTGVARLNVEKLANQVELEGTLDFTGLAPLDQLSAEHDIRSTNNGTSHRLRFLDAKANYVFTMKSATSWEFKAVRADINPATGKPLI
jgi:hypothetical protein